MKTEQEIMEKIKEYDGYVRHPEILPDMTRTEYVQYEYKKQALEWVLE